MVLMKITDPFRIGTAFFSPRILLVTKLVSSAATLGIAVTYDVILSLGQHLYREWRTEGNIRNVS